MSEEHRSLTVVASPPLGQKQQSTCNKENRVTAPAAWHSLVSQLIAGGSITAQSSSVKEVLQSAVLAARQDPKWSGSGLPESLEKAAKLCDTAGAAAGVSAALQLLDFQHIVARTTSPGKPAVARPASPVNDPTTGSEQTAATTPPASSRVVTSAAGLLPRLVAASTASASSRAAAESPAAAATTGSSSTPKPEPIVVVRHGEKTGPPATATQGTLAADTVAAAAISTPAQQSQQQQQATSPAANSAPMLLPSAAIAPAAAPAVLEAAATIHKGPSALDVLGSAAEAMSASEAASMQGPNGRPSKSPASPDKHHKDAPAGAATVSARALADAAVNATEGMQARPSPFGTEQQQQVLPGSRSPGQRKRDRETSGSSGDSEHRPLKKRGMVRAVSINTVLKCVDRRNEAQGSVEAAVGSRPTTVEDVTDGHSGMQRAHSTGQGLAAAERAWQEPNAPQPSPGRDRQGAAPAGRKHAGHALHMHRSGSGSIMTHSHMHSNGIGKTLWHLAGSQAAPANTTTSPSGTPPLAPSSLAAPALRPQIAMPIAPLKLEPLPGVHSSRALQGSRSDPGALHLQSSPGNTESKTALWSGKVKHKLGSSTVELFVMTCLIPEKYLEQMPPTLYATELAPQRDVKLGRHYVMRCRLNFLSDRQTKKLHMLASGKMVAKCALQHCSITLVPHFDRDNHLGVIGFLLAED